MRANPGEREKLLEILLGSTGKMPGCLSYVIARDATDADILWVTEVWTDKAGHDASLAFPAVQAAIAEARPLIAAFESSVTTQPVGGVGLPANH